MGCRGHLLLTKLSIMPVDKPAALRAFSYALSMAHASGYSLVIDRGERSEVQRQEGGRPVRSRPVTDTSARQALGSY